ncbi:MAG: hypothetical protein QNK30_09380 [Bacteroidales bacterium]|nr:hypothetical protein [Bacteroidales bacterium]
MNQNSLDSKTSANYSGFSLVSGGLIYSITKIFRRKAKPGKELIHTAIALSVITWLPVCLLALFGGTLNDSDATINFFEDFLLHVRFLLVVPFLILIEKIVDRSFVKNIENSDDLIPNSQQESFNKLVKRLNRLTDSFIPEIVMLIIVYGTIIIFWHITPESEAGRNYLLNTRGDQLNPAGWYYLIISMPIFQMLIFRWIWRWFIWLYSIVAISKYKLHVDPLHADQMAGLEYLNLVPLVFSFILMAPSAVLSAYIGIDIIYNDAILKSYAFQIILYVFLLPIIIYSPLLVYMPFLLRSKSDGIYEFGSLVRKHNNNFANKWIGNYQANKDDLLGSVDNSSLADINGSYGPIAELKIIPIDLKFLVISFVLNIIPYLPLVFTYYSVKDLVNLLLQSVAG